MCENLSARQGLDHHSPLALLADQQSAGLEDRFHRSNDSVEAARRASLLRQSGDAKAVSLAVLNDGQELDRERHYLELEI